MKRHAILIMTGLCFVFAPPVLADDDKPIEVGDKAPEVKLGSWGKWLNLPKGVDDISLKKLKGHIVVIDFWSTKCGPCKRIIPQVSELQKKYKKDAVVVLAMSNERGTVVKKYAKQNKIDYIVAGDAEETMKKYGIKGYPTIFVIGPKCKVEYKGHDPREAEKAVKWLIEFQKPKFKGILFEADAQVVYKRARRLLKRKEYLEALETYKETAATYGGTPTAKKAKAKVKKIESSAKIMAKIKKAEQKRECKRWLQLARENTKRGDIQKAAKYYRQVIKEYPDSDYADTAKEELAGLLH